MTRSDEFIRGAQERIQKDKAKARKTGGTEMTLRPTIRPDWKKQQRG